MAAEALAIIPAGLLARAGRTKTCDALATLRHAVNAILIRPVLLMW